MKRIILSAVLCLSIGLAFAQDDYKKIAQETCDCMTKQNLESQSKTEIQTALGLCMLEVIQKNKIDVDISDGDAMRELGQKVGVTMAPLCPSVFKLFLKEKFEDDTDQKITSLEGKIKSVDEDGFLSLTLKESSGNEHRIIWFFLF